MHRRGVVGWGNGVGESVHASTGVAGGKLACFVRHGLDGLAFAAPFAGIYGGWPGGNATVVRIGVLPGHGNGVGLGMKLWLLRHAPVLLAPGFCYGASDVAADAMATQQAALDFSSHPAEGSLLYSSPSVRAKQLAQVLHSKRPDLQKPVVDQRLCEMDFGCWEMHAWEKIPRPAMDAWVADFPDHRFGGKESTQEVIDRVAWALRSMKKLNVPEAVWVTHAGVIKSVQFLMANAGRRRISSAEEWPIVSLPFGAWIEVDVSAYDIG